MKLLTILHDIIVDFRYESENEIIKYSELYTGKLQPLTVNPDFLFEVELVAIQSHSLCYCLRLIFLFAFSDSKGLLRLLRRNGNWSACRAGTKLSSYFDEWGLKKVVRDEGHKHRQTNEEHCTEYKIMNAKNHKNQVQHWSMEQVHAIRVQGNLVGHGVERFNRGVMKCVNAESEKQAKYPTDPEPIDKHAGLGETVTGE
jgi:hypothetical protein